MKTVIREDYSTWHTFFFDMETGEPDHGATCQGYRDGSAWARGQAWGIYGCALAYKYTGRKEYIDIFKKVSDYFLRHLPEDMIPYWDLEFTSGDEPRDSSSASIAACGMLEMAKYLEKEDAEVDRKLAGLHSTYSKKPPYNTCNPYGVDECNLWGDYFYMEALTRLLKDWKLYW
mgnify:CR=1 FL=1